MNPSLRKIGIWLVALSPIIASATFAVWPISETPILGSLSEFRATFGTIGLFIWALGCAILLIWRIKNFRKTSIPIIVWIFAALSVIGIAFSAFVLSADQYCTQDCALGYILIGLFPVIATFAAIHFLAGLWLTIALILKPHSKKPTR